MRHHRGRPLSRQEEPNLPEGVAGAESIGRFVTVVQDFGVSLLDEVNGGSIVVDGEDCRTRFDFDLTHRARELVQLLSGKIGEAQKWRDPTRIHDRIVPQGATHERRL